MCKNFANFVLQKDFLAKCIEMLLPTYLDIGALVHHFVLPIIR